jgi:hypothetical protein
LTADEAQSAVAVPPQACSRNHSQGMVKFRLPCTRTAMRAAIYYRYGNHVEVPLVAAKTGSPRLVKIFIKFECLEFDESSR